jgi:hypothetical protein
MDHGPSEKNGRIGEGALMPVSKRRFGFLIATILGIMLTNGTGFSADLPSAEENGIEIKAPDRSSTEGSTKVEQLRMEGTEIQGTLEKPHVVYVIPWKELPDVQGGELPLRRSFKDEIWEPVDRERFMRQWENFHR